MVLLGETPSSTQLLGVALVIGGIAAATIPAARMRDSFRRLRATSTPG
jgi:drug/metabolite transporter (DMT)-like permease